MGMKNTEGLLLEKFSELTFERLFTANTGSNTGIVKINICIFLLAYQ